MIRFRGYTGPMDARALELEAGAPSDPDAARAYWQARTWELLNAPADESETLGVELFRSSRGRWLAFFNDRTGREWRTAWHETPEPALAEIRGTIAAGVSPCPYWQAARGLRAHPLAAQLRARAETQD